MSGGGYSSRELDRPQREEAGRALGAAWRVSKAVRQVSEANGRSQRPSQGSN